MQPTIKSWILITLFSQAGISKHIYAADPEDQDQQLIRNALAQTAARSATEILFHHQLYQSWQLSMIGKTCLQLASAAAYTCIGKYAEPSPAQCKNLLKQGLATSKQQFVESLIPYIAVRWSQQELAHAIDHKFPAPSPHPATWYHAGVQLVTQFATATTLYKFMQRQTLLHTGLFAAACTLQYHTPQKIDDMLKTGVKRSALEQKLLLMRSVVPQVALCCWHQIVQPRIAPL